jgi:adenosylhomocysteine nucleosidase
MAVERKDPAVLFALAREARPFLAGFSVRRRVAGGPAETYLCEAPGSSLTVMVTGVGHERMGKALDWLLNAPRERLPGLIVSAGFCGALVQSVAVGDIVVATDIVSSDGGRHKAARLSEGASSTYQSHLGPLLSTDQMVVSCEERRALAARHGAIAVDMETATLARLCTAHGIPFSCIRAVSDDAQTSLSPEMAQLIVNGKVSARRLTAAVLRRPAFTAELWRLARNSRLAADRLALALRHLLLPRRSSSAS